MRAGDSGLRSLAAERHFQPFSQKQATVIPSSVSFQTRCATSCLPLVSTKATTSGSSVLTSTSSR